MTNARYTRFNPPAPAPNDPRIPDDPEDRQLPNTPTYTMNFGLSYEIGLGRMGDMRARVGRTSAAAERIPKTHPSCARASMASWMLSWCGCSRMASPRWRCFAENLFDREYVVNGINFGAPFGHALLIYNEPRTYGVELRRRF